MDRSRFIQIFLLIALAWIIPGLETRKISGDWPWPTRGPTTLREEQTTTREELTTEGEYQPYSTEEWKTQTNGPEEPTTQDWAWMTTAYRQTRPTTTTQPWTIRSTYRPIRWIYRRCECGINIRVNSTSCTHSDGEGSKIHQNNISEDTCEVDFSVEDLGTRYQYLQSGCEGCLHMLKACPRECVSKARSYWGTEGLYRNLVTDTPWGPREQRLGQAYCERYNGEILPPGAYIFSEHTLPDCDEKFTNMNFYAKLCCAMFDVPVVGKVPIWDYNCNGIIENGEHILANIKESNDV
ncbi:unnamed protein product [Owenia fusiformis]|uniref:Uncharacterized protein n=1 Tax=Owenia fusiformis TaxID=6347 RepID=A0A8J1XKA1_OWEFU|nr:unnamed protein product [Owenia fusiformis]